MKTNLKQIRESKTSYTQEDMATMLGISVSAYSKWEQGQRELRGYDIVRLTKILKTSSDEIIGTDYSHAKKDEDIITEQVTHDEQRLLDAYRNLDDTDRATVTRVVYALLDTAEHGGM